MSGSTLMDRIIRVLRVIAGPLVKNTVRICKFKMFVFVVGG